jgi:hypothetical protein
MKLLTILLACILASSAEASNNQCVNQWEYFTKSYRLGQDDPATAKWRLSGSLTKAGNRGWELVQVVNGGSDQYAIFKRPKSECVSAEVLKENKGITKRP